jgi:hypothetical protein
VNVGELITELKKYRADMPVRTFGEVVRLEAVSFYGDIVLYLIGEEDQ